MIIYDNNKYGKLKPKNYTTIIRDFYGTLALEIGVKKPKKKRKPKKIKLRKKDKISTHGVKKELLEYHYGIYRMFPCGKQYRYHMQFIHVDGVTERDIR